MCVCVCVCVCVCMHVCVCVAKPVAVELRCHATALIILAGNDDMHESSEEFEFWPDWTTHCGVSCPLMCEKIPIGL